MLGFDFRLLEALDFETLFVSDELFIETVDLGSTSSGCSGVATPKNVVTASHELRNREGSGFDFTGSGAGPCGSSNFADGSAGNTAFGGLVGPSVFFAVGLSEGVLSRFAMLFQ